MAKLLSLSEYRTVQLVHKLDNIDEIMAISCNSPISIALVRGITEAIPILMGAGPNLNSSKDSDWAPSGAAVCSGQDVGVLRTLKEGEARVAGTAIVYQYRTTSAITQSPDITRVLLEPLKQLDLNQGDSMNLTLLLYAPRQSNVASGADINLRGNRGETALRNAIHYHMAAFRDFLLVQPEVEMNYCSAYSGVHIFTLAFHKQEFLNDDQVHTFNLTPGVTKYQKRESDHEALNTKRSFLDSITRQNRVR
ncbi:hypothetical protein BBP40_002932 [Aspergillus hancockii]|nr:hypothetical protein BBP40_002932 [Aspergillus hancockii]